MRKFNKKGFTIVELVIVIAVIAILAGVLIPTFSGIVKNAQASAEQQKVTNAYKEAYANELIEGNGFIKDGESQEVNDIKFTFDVDSNGKLTSNTAIADGVADGTGIDNAKYTYTYNAATNTWTVTAK